MRGLLSTGTVPLLSSRTVIGLAAIAGIILAPFSARLQPGMVAHAASDSGTLVMVTDGSASDLDPASDEQAASDTIQRNIYEELVALKGSSLDEYAPRLATSWASNADHSVWTFHLRHGARFHTGREVTADDVKYSIARTITAQLAGSYVFSRFMNKPDKQIKVLDRYTVEFDLGVPQPLFLAATTSEYTGAIIDSTELKKHIVKGDSGHAWLTENDIGSGPYMLKTWQHGQQLTLVKFPGYWGGWSGKHFSTIIVKTVPEPTTRRELLERGQADLTFDLTPQDSDALSHEQGVKVIARYATEVQYLDMTEAGPLASPLARQALSWAFNYDAYLKAAYRSYARRLYGPLPSVLLGYDPTMFHYHTDLNKARQLLQQAGVKPGTTLTFVHSNYYYYTIAAGILTAQLAQLGIVVKQQSLDPAAFNSIYFKTEPAAQHPNLLTYNWWPDYNDPWDMANPMIYSKSAGAAGANSGYYHNSTVDTLMDASATADRSTLIRNFKTIQDITSRQDPPAIWLAEPAEVTVMRSNVNGFVFNPVEVQTYNFYALYR